MTLKNYYLKHDFFSLNCKKNEFFLGIYRNNLYFCTRIWFSSIELRWECSENLRHYPML